MNLVYRAFTKKTRKMLGQLGMMAAGLLSNLGLSGWSDRRQLEQQRKLGDLQRQQQNKMARDQQGLALEMWKATNWAEQRKQMEKAGLNPGLMLGMHGGGGVTTGNPSANITGGNAPQGGGEPGMGIQMGLNAAMQKSQIELTKAQTKNLEVQTTKLAGADTAKTSAETENIKQQTLNAKTQAELMELDKKLKDFQNRINTVTEKEIADTIRAGTQKAKAEATSADVKATVDTATQDKQIKIIENNAAEQALRMALIKAQTIQTGKISEETDGKIRKLGQEMWLMQQEAFNRARELNQKDTQLSQEQEKIMIQKLQAEFNTADIVTVKRAVDIWRTVVDGIMNVVKGSEGN